MKPCCSALLLAAACSLAACKGENKGADQRTAVGEILPGSASDAMVPYDSLRSQPPLAPNTGAATAGKDKGRSHDAGDAEPGVVASDGDTPTAPAEAPPTSPPEPAGE